jgi:hypothetical protein
VLAGTVLLGTVLLGTALLGTAADVALVGTVASSSRVIAGACGVVFIVQSPLIGD